MKKTLITAVMLLMVIGIVSSANAIPLPIGGSVVPTAPPGVASPGGALAAPPLSIPITGVDNTPTTWWTGTLNQWVRNSALGLVFEYQIIINAGAGAPILLMDTTIYSPFITNVDASGAGLVYPVSFARPIPGPTVSASFGVAGLGGPAQGQVTSGLMWIQTNANYYGWGTTQIQGTGQDAASTYCPIVPEPGSMALLGLGLLGFCGGILRKRFKA